MNARSQPETRKRAVNLTLNEDLVIHAKGMTDNLSGLVESLLTDYVEREQRARLTRSQAVASTVAMWNSFNDETGSFADEHSTL